MTNQLLDQVVRDCRRNILRHPQYEHFIHWTYLTFRNEILAKGVNRKHEPPKSLGYHNRVNDVKYKPKLHSEFDALRKCKRIRKGMEVINIRLAKNGETRMSCPCRACRDLLSLFNIKKLYFTTEHGWGQMTL